MSADFAGNPARAFSLGDNASTQRTRPAPAHEAVIEPDDQDDQDDSEARLGAGFAAGELRCLAEAYRSWSPLVYTMARRELGSAPDAEDLTQQVFLSAWNSRTTYQPSRGSFAGWLVGITRHRLLDHHRRRQRRRSLHDELEIAAAGSAVETLAVDPDLDRLVLAAEIARLPEPRGTIIRMAFWDGYSYSQIADQLRLPLGTVKSHVRRALLHLRSRLKESVTWTT